MGVPTDKDLERCACVRCPTYVQGDARLFCVRGKSKLDIVERGCICRTCAVHLQVHLQGRAYCLRGRPEEQ